MDRIYFTVNNERYSVGSELDSEVTLNDYLRKYLNLRGTKYMCKEGGCGACIVTVTRVDPLNNKKETISVNSCLVSMLSCRDWEISTIEEVGNRGKGYHAIQKNLNKHNGSQCGYCTPGWIMSMYSLMQNRPKMTMAEIEDSFGSNTCRCTGFRPILDAFKEFGSDAPKSDDLLDIEDLNNIKCKRTSNMCNPIVCEEENDWCFVKKEELEDGGILKINLRDNKVWYRVNTVRDIFYVFDREGIQSYMLVAGNTAKGAYPIEKYPDVLIDISGVRELKGCDVDQNLIIRAGTSLSYCLEIFRKFSDADGFEYLDKFYKHIQFVAHIPVRNIGTVGGNLMVKHQHNDFPSDMFLLLETVGAVLTIQSRSGREQVTIRDFLSMDMRGKVILNVLIPPFGNECEFISYKITPRVQNAHAIVNAGFLYTFERDDSTISRARIVFGGLSPKFIHATKTELYLVGRKIFKNSTLQGALNILRNELLVEENPTEGSVEFRRKLALGLFYKSLLEICPTDKLDDVYTSGGKNLRLRPLSHGKQVFDTNETVWPLNKPIQKVEGLIQCAGEAPYMDDIPTLPKEVYAAFVLSTVAVGEIDKIDPKSALDLNGVLAFYTAKDIPGLNTFTPIDGLFMVVNEEALCNGTVKYYNQPIGIVVAETEHLANKASKMVKITYRNVNKPVLNIIEAKKYPERIVLLNSTTATDSGSDIRRVIQGNASMFGQYHYTMETQVCVTAPSDDGFDIHSSNQWMDKVQMAVAQSLNIDANSINLAVRRVGGAYGGKISRALQIAVACNLVSYHLNRPCRFIMPLTSVMRAIGKRMPCTADFKISVNNSGVIQSLEYNIYEDNGYVINEPLVMLGLPSLQNCYRKDRWTYKVFNVTTDTASNSWCRSPGTLEQIAFIELIMEQISYEMSLDPVQVRIANLLDEPELLNTIQTILNDSDYEKRKKEVKIFNNKNKWKKRGLRMSPLRWPVPNLANHKVTLTVYHGDGTVVVTHAGIELGQGINTKVIQVCAYSLNLPISKVKVKASNIVTNPNSGTTGGSFTSEAVCLGVIKCCQMLIELLKPIKQRLGDASWEVLVETAHKEGVHLFTNYNVTSNELKNYNVYGATVSEVEVDILTGEIQILRVDLIEDVGQSLSPAIDVGQVEGAFIMGLGYWTSENLVYNPSTGELLTDRSWNYYVPLAKDIPIDFRVYFKRNSFNDLGVLGSKATGEPAICMSISIAFAIREAIAAAREDRGLAKNIWFQMDGPCTNENIIMSADTRIEDFKFQ